MQNKPDFSQWTINSELFCLQDMAGNEMYMQPRLIKLLAVFTQSPNRVIQKSELSKMVWDDVLVGDESLSKAVFDLRQFLNENFSNPPQIVTIRKVGYRFQLAQKPVSRKQIAIKVFKKVAYVAILFIIAVLMIRGIGYE